MQDTYLDLNKDDLIDPIVSENALTVLKNRYLAKDDNGNIVEDPKDMYIRVAKAVSLPEKEEDRELWFLKFYEIMARNLFIPNSPTMMNAGRRLGMLSACFTLPVDDDLDNIFTSIKSTALVQRAGGGTGFNFSDLRPNRSIVKSSGGSTAGPLSFIDVFSSATTAIQQGAFRRGANMGLLHCEHPDIVDFIKAKSDFNRWQNYNISVVVTDQFIENIKTTPDHAHQVHHDKWGSGYLWHNIHTDEVRAFKTNDTIQDSHHWKAWTYKDTWELICHRAWETGEPGLFFIDTANSNNPVPSLGKIRTTNPCGEIPMHEYDSCLAGDSLVLTHRGVERIDNMYCRTVLGTDRKLQNHKGVFKKGKKQTYILELSNGLTIKATADHKFLLEGNTFKELQQLVVGDRLKVLTQPTIQAYGNYNKTYEMYGWMHGDGWYSKSVGISFNYQDGDIEAKDKLLPSFHNEFGTHNRKPLRDDDVSYSIQTETNTAIAHCEELGFVACHAANKVLPISFWDWELLHQISFMRGLFGADGSIIGKTKSQIQLASTSIELIKQTQKFLAALGIHSSIYTTIFKNNNRKDQHKLNISKQSANYFAHYIGFSNQKKNDIFTPTTYQDEESFVISSITKASIEEVYDLGNVTNTNAFFANGIAVHNCTLGSLNLPKFLKTNPYVDLNFLDINTILDGDKLAEAIELSTRFLDNVIEINRYPILEIENMSKRTRRIGLGVMGFADLLFSIGIPYSSDHARQIARQIQRFISRIAENYSSQLGEEKGSFLEHSQSRYATDKPMRNAYRTTVAPTGTISIIANCSGGIEPIFALAFKREVMPDGDGKFVTMEEVNPYFKEAVEKSSLTTDEKDRILKYAIEHGTIKDFDQVYTSSSREAFKNLRNIFVTSHDIDPKDHVLMQAAWQKYIDNAISKTINLRHDSTPKDVMQAYLLAHETLCKGVTVYRDGCRENQAGMKQPMKINKKDETKVEEKRNIHSQEKGSDFQPAVRSRIRTPWGNLHVTIVLDENDNEYEIFAQLGKSGDAIHADLEGLCRVASLYLRNGNSIDDLIEQWSGIGSITIMPSQDGKIASIPDALAKVLIKYRNSKGNMPARPVTIQTKDYSLPCPSCKNSKLVTEEGCSKCYSCGYSQC